MKSLLDEPNFWIENRGEEDHYGDATPLAVTPEEERQRDVVSLQRSLAGIEFRLAELEGLPPVPDPVAERRRELLTERKAVQKRLKELGG